METKLTYAHSFLCGHLNLTISTNTFRERATGWQEERLNNKEFKLFCNFYYEKFVDSMVAHERQSNKGIYSEIAHFTYNYGEQQSCEINKDDFSYQFNITKLHLFFFPHNIILYAIEIDESKEVLDLNALTFAHILLRDTTNYGSLSNKNYIDSLNPIIDLIRDNNREVEYAYLTHTGNKLKVFQLIYSESVDDELIFELGTLSNIGCVKDKTDNNSPSDRYFNEIIDNHTLSVFNNWKMLALFDTVTLIGKLDSFWAWENSYFRLIYIHALYQKSMLFMKNQEFHSPDIDEKTTHKLAIDMKENEHYYAFSNISYNFMPQLIYKKIDLGLDIAFERRELHEHIENDEQHQQSISNRKLERLLYAITIITLLSCFNDGTDFISNFFGHQPGSCEFKWISISVFVVIMSIILNQILKNRK